MEFPKTVRIGFTGPIHTDISLVSIANKSQFHSRVFFTPNVGFGTLQIIFNCGLIPLSAFVPNEAGAVKLAASIASQAVGWRSTETFGTPTLIVG